MTDVFRLTADFARDVLKMSSPPPEPTRLNEERKIWAHRAFSEEVQEFLEANTLEDEVDAICDLIYFAAGRLYEMGVDGALHFEEVHGANVEKRKGRLEKRSHGLSDEHGMDAVKPTDWTPPDHTALLAFQRGELALAFRTRSGKMFALDPALGLKAVKRKPKVLILGHARHGKDTVAEMLRDKYGYTFASSSMFCAERVMMPHFNSLPSHPGYATVEDCYEDRVNHRATWFQQIEAYNSPDRSRLAREMLETNDLYVGMRSAREFAEARPLFDHVVWVDAKGRGVAPEDRDSFDIDFKPDMWLVRNDGTLEDLEAAVDRLALILETPHAPS